MQNHDIALTLMKIADELEINGHNPYRVRAYRRAARSIDRSDVSIEELVKAGEDITTLANVGTRIAGHIKAILTTGTVPFYFYKSNTEKKFRDELIEIEGLGRKRIQLLRKKLNIKNIKDLKRAIDNKSIYELSGFSEKLVKKIKLSIENPKPYEKLFKYRLGELILESLIGHINSLPTVHKVVCAGNYRRKAEVIGNVVLLITGDRPDFIIDNFVKFDEVKELIEVSVRYARVILQSGMLVEVKVISNDNFGTELILATGSSQHIHDLSVLAEEKGYIFNDKGLHRDNTLLSFSNESEFYNKLSLKLIEPELREGRGEILASQKLILPNLVTLEEIRGDLHSHTNETDGVETLEAMVTAAIAKGYSYLAITDHSKRLAITNGLDEIRLRKQMDKIDQLNSQLKNFTILKSIEVDILENGDLDLPNWILKELDLCVCSVHSRFNLSLEKQTERIIRAMDNPYFNILGHATGRLINYRKPYAIDIERILGAARERNCIIELNAQPSRLDIKDLYCQLAKLMGVKIAISSDAHSIYELEYMRFGVMQARRGWLEAKDVINTRDLKDLKKVIKRF